MDTEEKDSEFSIVNLYRQEFELLKGMFEDNFSSEVIAGVLEDCDGDVNLAVDTLTKIDTSSDPVADSPTEAFNVDSDITTVTECNENTAPDDTNLTDTLISYAAASKTTNAGAMSPGSRTSPPRPRNRMPKVDYWTDQMRQIVTNFNEGNRILIIMRGAPGCGKSYLAKVIVESTVGNSNPKNYDNHIFSADDLMVWKGVYCYDKSRLEEVHARNQSRVYKALKEGVSPVIVDNTNMTAWEMHPYVRDGVMNGYIIEVLEPSNPWCHSTSQLAKRNVHNVPKEKIQLMLRKYDGYYDGPTLIKNFKIDYPCGMKPPVKRNIPPYYNKDKITNKSIKVQMNENYDILPTVVTQAANNLSDPDPNVSNSPVTEKVQNWLVSNNEKYNSNTGKTPNHEEQLVNDLKVETNWENGESWDTPQIAPNKPTEDDATSSNPKPQRSKFNQGPNKFINPSILSDVWIENLNLNDKSSSNLSSPNLVQPESIIDTDNSLAVVTLSGKEANTSQTVNNESANATTSDGKCVNEEKHFKHFKKMFKNVPRPVLRDIFESCKGDMDWASIIVLDGIKQNNLGEVGHEQSDSEEDEETDCQCSCVIPRDIEIPESILSPASERVSQNDTPLLKKKPKKDKTKTDDSIKIKKQIENTVRISEHHYSQHHLNIKQRYDSKNPNASLNPSNEKESLGLNVLAQQINLPASSSTNESFKISQNQPTTSSSAKTDIDAVPSTSKVDELNFFDYDDYDNASDVEADEFVTVNMGMEFIYEIDELCNREGFIYPPQVKPILSMPKKILTEINALWIEAISYQMDNIEGQTAEMIEQDEQFARELDRKLQIEALQEESSFEDEKDDDKVQPPGEPNFKEIMDSELALAIYAKEVKQEWKDKEPQDMAAQMTRMKLYALFPTVDQETLSEMLIAHDNSFNNTMQVLLLSTGQGHHLDKPNGINKFIKQKEKENKNKLLEAEKESVLCEKEYPFLSKPGEPPNQVTLKTVTEWREKAEDYRISRDIFLQKAKLYFDTKKFQAASYCSQMAAFHTAKFENASNLAAAALVQYHANAHPDSNILDLHYLRVAEAETTLDLFIDERLRRIRNGNQRPLLLHIITGRGKHSPGRPRVKPAVIRRLALRGLLFQHQNPGMILARLKSSNLLLDEILNS